MVSLHHRKIGLLFFFGIHLILFSIFLFKDLYTFLLILLHLFSLLILSFFIFDISSLPRFINRHKIDIGIITFLFVVGFAIRIYRVSEITPGMWGDEVGYAILGEQIVDSHWMRPFTDDLFAPPTPFFYIIGSTVKLLGRSLVTVRLPAIFFGALALPAIYGLLLEIFKRRSLAISGSAVMLVLYHHMIISRFAYEMSAAVFFEIGTLFFLHRSYKTLNIYNYLRTVVFLSLGLYSYVAFRTNALFLGCLLTIILYKSNFTVKEKIQKLGIILSISFIFLTPWIAFSLHHPQHVMARAKAISVFHQGFSNERLIQEIAGSAKNSFGMFFLTGDPNPRQNPSRVSMYDPVFMSTALIGLWYLFRKNKIIALAGIFLMIPSFINDIFSIELFPEFHYPGTGHPSATRVLTLIPIMICFFTAGCLGILHFPFFSGKKKILTQCIFAAVVFLTCFVNWRLYFNQPLSEFIYAANKVQMIDILGFINQAAKFNTYSVAVSKSIYDDQRIQYFANSKVRLIPLAITNEEKSIDLIPIGENTLIDTISTPEFAKKIVTKEFREKYNLDINGIPTPWEGFNTLIVYRNK